MSIKTFLCQYCGREKFLIDIAKWNRSKNHYCSRSCSNSNRKGKKLSEEHRAKVIKTLVHGIMKKRIPWNKGLKFPGKSGANCHLWKGGITKLSIQIRMCEEYRIWRRKCLERDNFTCVLCAQRGGDKCVDHIEDFAGILKRYNIVSLEQAQKCEELWNVQNGRTLCLKCHANTNTFPSNLRRYTKSGKYKYIGKFLKVNCRFCNKEFKTREYLLTIKKGKYCSQLCYWNNKVGKTRVKKSNKEKKCLSSMA